MWEQRYNALNPKRSEGNTRSYDNTQLRRLLNIVSLMGDEFKVSQLCTMPDEELFILQEQKLIQTNVGETTHEFYVSQFIAAATIFDERQFEKIFASCVDRLGIKDAYIKVIYPMIYRIGLLWVADKFSPAYEHFSSNIVRRKLLTAIDDLPLETSSKNSWLLFLPENEFHETGLLFAHYLIRLAGHKVTYLGSNVPFETLTQAVEEIKPSNLLFFMVHYNSPEITQGYVNALKKHAGKGKIHYSGNEKLIQQLNPDKGCVWLRDVVDLEMILNPS